jgi:hypothetical protein
MLYRWSTNLCSVFILDLVVVVVVAAADFHRCIICIKVTCVSICKSRVLFVSVVGGVCEEGVLTYVWRFVQLEVVLPCCLIFFVTLLGLLFS